MARLLLLGCVTHQVRYSSSRCRSPSPSLAAKGLSFFGLLLLKRLVYLVAVALLLAANCLRSLAFQARCSCVVALHPGACRLALAANHTWSHLLVSKPSVDCSSWSVTLLARCSFDVSMIALHPGNYCSFARGKHFWSLAFGVGGWLGGVLTERLWMVIFIPTPALGFCFVFFSRIFLLII